MTGAHPGPNPLDLEPSNEPSDDLDIDFDEFLPAPPSSPDVSSSSNDTTEPNRVTLVSWGQSMTKIQLNFRLPVHYLDRLIQINLLADSITISRLDERFTSFKARFTSYCKPDKLSYAIDQRDLCIVLEKYEAAWWNALMMPENVADGFMQ